MKFNKEQDYWATCYCTKEFLLIETQSGLGRTSADPLFPPHLLLPEADDECAGETILQALSNSRTLNKLEDRVAFFDLEKGKEKYAAWIAMLMDKYGYKTKRALFKDMKHCIIHCVNGVITISPTCHEKLEGWGRTKGDGIEDVILPADSSPAEIGAGLRLALSRCKD
ncbi:CdiI family contact-dependent growth inhibition immunity protein [Salmonella enterica]|nr:CdiI family contact-dependent growth inhibition immunity protein [Salmonella enterica]EJJ4080919.1 CdiI family contact-dependent growth inhibition immunity protein [Salmonella enterica]